MAIISPYTFADLKTPKTPAVNKASILQNLVDKGITAALSWVGESVPNMLVETEADATSNFQFAQQQILLSRFNRWATGEAHTEHSLQVYNNTALEGARLIGRIQLTDTGAGPWQITPASISASVGIGGLQFDGRDDPTGLLTSPITLPKNGSCYVYVQAPEIGAKYNVNVGAINTLARGGLPGVTVTNPSDWLTAAGTVQGSDQESEDQLRARNTAKWGTLGVGSPASAYENWIRSVSPLIKRVKILSNLDMLDPGTVTALIAGDAGAVSPDIVLAVQNLIAPTQIGGGKIPETARFVCASAVNRTIPISASLYVPGALNTPAFLALIQADIAAYQASLDIGPRLSWERVLQVTTNVAGLDPKPIVDEDWNAPVDDTLCAYNEVVVFDVSGIALVSV